jgi:hypothetical protein
MEQMNPNTLANELIKMAEIDRAMRSKHLEANNEWDASIDEHHTKRLQEIVKQYGWPTISSVGKEAASAAWLLVQHADLYPDFQQECLALIYALSDGDIAPDNLAFLEDRVRVNTHRPQLYGTQFSIRKGAFGPLPIEDFESLGERRVVIGLKPFEDYVTEMREVYDRHQEAIRNSE